MALLIKTDTFFTNKVRSLQNSNISGLINEYKMRNSFEESSVNTVTNISDLTKIDDPIFFDSYAQIGTNGGFEIDINTLDLTMVAICKADFFDGFTLAIGGDERIGWTKYVNNIHVSNNSGVNEVVFPIPSSDNFNFLSATLAYHGATNARNYIDGELQSYYYGGPGGNRSSGVRLGYLGTYNVPYFAIYNRILTDEELDTLYLDLKTYFSKDFTI